MRVLWLFLFVFLLIIFHGAFQTAIFKDDYYLFSISRATNLGQFAAFFAPFKNYGFYRPLGIEVFYFFVGLINNLLITRLLIFALFFLGLSFLYKTLFVLTKQRWLSFLAVAMYSASSTHVYQLYWLATFQEVAVFAFSVISTYLFLKKKFFWSLVVFLAALLSREEAMLLPLVLLFLDRGKHWRNLLIFFLVSAAFFVLYRVNFAQVTVRPEYAPHLNLRLIGNNVLWYLLWSLGAPSFAPDYFTSIFRLPLANFWSVVTRLGALPYLVILLGYWLVFIANMILTSTRARFKVLGVGLILFLLYILPMSIIIHKWMVRLTVPLIFLTFWQAYIIFHSKKFVAGFLILTYCLFNVLAISVEETSSTFRLESRISRNVALAIEASQAKILDSGVIYFQDREGSQSGWQGSQKLKVSLSDQWFLSYYFPGKRITAVYNFENESVPTKAVVIDSQKIISDPITPSL